MFLWIYKSINIRVLRIKTFEEKEIRDNPEIRGKKQNPSSC